MRTSPIPLVGGAYADESRPWTQQDTCNYLPCRAERSGTRSPEKLKTPPGLRPFVEIPATTPPEWTPVRGIHNCEGRLFAVIGQTLYQVTSAGVAIPRGTIPGYGRVSMEHNQISLGNELTVVNGSAGYVYNTVTGVFARITDPGYPGSSTVRFIDSYMIGIEPQGRYAFNSDPANATSFNTLDRFTSEVRPDPLVAMAVSNNELVLFSAESGEFFYNSGAAQQPFRTKRITMDKGAAGPYVVIEADNTVFWLGSDGSFYQLQGYTPARISTRPIEQAINGLDWTKAYAFVWEDAGHTVIYWTFPDGRTWGWDVSQQEWHRRESYGLDRWRVSCMAWFGNRCIAGDFQKGRLWHVDWDYVLEGDQEFISSRTLAVIHDNQNLVRVPRLELVMDTGQPETVVEAFPGQPAGPSITGDAPAGIVDSAYSYAYTPTGGTAPLVVALAPGSDPLPTGLTLSTAGVLSGTPTAAATYSWVVRVTDANGLYADLADSADIGLATVKLATTRIGYTGFASALAAGATLGVSVSANQVRLSPGGLYCAASIMAVTVGDYFKIAKFDTVTDTWSILPNPADMPAIGPVGMIWPDDNTLVIALDNTNGNDFDVWVYTRSGDTFTRVSAYNDAAMSAPVEFGIAVASDNSKIAVTEANGANTFNVFDFNGTSLTNKRGEAGAGTLSNFIRLAFRADAVTGFVAAANTAVLEVYSDNGSALTLVDTLAVAGNLGLYWYGEYLYAVGVDGGAVYSISVVRFNAGSLTLESSITLPAITADSTITPDGAYIALGGATVPIYAVSTATPPVISLSYTAPSAGGTVSSVSWSAINE